MVVKAIGDGYLRQKAILRNTSENVDRVGRPNNLQVFRSAKYSTVVCVLVSPLYQRSFFIDGEIIFDGAGRLPFIEVTLCSDVAVERNFFEVEAITSEGFSLSACFS
jgi:hypothetical protein